MSLDIILTQGAWANVSIEANTCNKLPVSSIVYNCTVSTVHFDCRRARVLEIVDSYIVCWNWKEIVRLAASQVITIAGLVEWHSIVDTCLPSS